MNPIKQKAEDKLTKTVKSLPLQPSINNKVQPSMNSKLETTQEVTHVEFLKVHKAASSTVQSIILRFGLERNLSMVIPTPVHYISKQKYYFSDIWPSFHESPSVREEVCGNIDKKLKYDILSHHMVFNHKKVSQLLHNDTVYVAIVRDPFDLFVSAAIYYKFALKKPYYYLSKLSNETFITDLIRNPKQYEASSNSESMTYNLMSYDFGLECLDVRKPEKCTDEIFHAFLNKTRDIFDVVMIVEKFDESLVFLKRYMNWSMKDILYTKINRFSSDQFSNFSESFNVTADDMAVFKERNKFDYGIYNLFKHRLDEQISVQKDLKDEVTHFKMILRDVQVFCESNAKTEASREDIADENFQNKTPRLAQHIDVKNKKLLKSIKMILTTKIVSRRQEEELFELFDLIEKDAIETTTEPISVLLPLLFEDKINIAQSKLFIPKSKWNKDFYVSTRDCAIMMKEIMPLYDVVKHNHLKILIERKLGHSFSLIEAVEYLSTFT
jgi:hypothetical protein